MTSALAAAGIVVRQLGEPDAPAYRALRLENVRAFPQAHRPEYDEALAQPLAWSEQRLATPGDYWFGAFDAQELVGAIGLRTQAGQKVRHVATLSALMVHPGRQRQGFGAKLVAHLIGFARSLGHIRQVKLALVEGNTGAERLYDAFGFEQFGFERDAFMFDGRYYAQQHRHLFLDAPPRIGNDTNTIHP
jgi:GNAT superfamily N-acetyltransferase